MGPIIELNKSYTCRTELDFGGIRMCWKNVRQLIMGEEKVMTENMTIDLRRSMHYILNLTVGKN